MGGALMITAAWLAPASAQPTNVAQSPAVAPFRIENSEIRAPLAGLRGDPTRGRGLVLNPAEGTCRLCHAVPDSGQPTASTVGPPLAGVGGRLNEGQLRLRLVDSTRINPQTAMPAYHRVAGLERVAVGFRGKPVFTAQQIEDVVAYLRELK